MSEQEIILKKIRWQVAYNVLYTRDIEAADQMYLVGATSAADNFLIIINMCNKGLGLPFVSAEEASSNKYLEDIVKDISDL